MVNTVFSTTRSQKNVFYCNIPFFLNGNSVGSYSYQSNQGARQDLYVFAARTYMSVIEQTMSMNSILPHGTCVKFDVDEYLSEIVDGLEESNYPETPDTTMPTMNPNME